MLLFSITFRTYILNLKSFYLWDNAYIFRQPDVFIVSKIVRPIHIKEVIIEMKTRQIGSSRPLFWGICSVFDVRDGQQTCLVLERTSKAIVLLIKPYCSEKFSFPSSPC